MDVVLCSAATLMRIVSRYPDIMVYYGILWWTYDIDKFPLEIDDFFHRFHLRIEIVHPA